MTRFAFFTGVLAIVLLAIAGPAYRLHVLSLGLALLGAASGFLLFVVTFIIGAIGLLAGGKGALDRSRAAIPVIALSLIFTIVAGVWISRGSGTPPIHDVTTDPQDPPKFNNVVSLRAAAGAVNSSAYQRTQLIHGNLLKVPDAQRSAYPDIQPLALTQPAPRTFQMAQQVARDMGWDIVAVAPSEGRIEATATTWYFGFKDDVVIRVGPESTGSRVDVRSESRVGVGDAGTNARRVRAYLAKLRELAAK
jgi:uncharacterized protein (DUF1499 family)